MTATVRPDPDRVLEAYLEATRIVASPQLVRRFQASVSEERARAAARPWSGALARLTGTRWRLRDSIDVAFAPHVTFALRLQSLALVLLMILALGAVVGGAGAVVVRVVTGPDRHDTLPASLLIPDPSSRTTVPSPTPMLRLPPTSRIDRPSSTVPVVTVRVLAQQAPRRAREGKRRSVGDPTPAAVRGCPVSLITHTDRVTVSTQRSWSRGRSCAS